MSKASPAKPSSPPRSSSTASLSLPHGSPGGKKTLSRRVSDSKPMRILKNIASKASIKNHGRHRSSSSIHSGRSGSSEPDVKAQDANDVPDVPIVKDDMAPTQPTKDTLEAKEEIEGGHVDSPGETSAAPVASINGTEPRATAENTALAGGVGGVGEHAATDVANRVHSSGAHEEEEARLAEKVEIVSGARAREIIQALDRDSAHPEETAHMHSRETAGNAETTPSTLGDSIVVVVVPPADDSRQVDMASERDQQKQLSVEQLATIDPFIVADSEDVASGHESDGNDESSAVVSAVALSPPPSSSARLASASPFTAEHKSAEGSQNESERSTPTASVESAQSEEEAPELHTPVLTISSLFLPIPNADPLTSLLIKYVPEHTRRPPRDISGEWQHTDFHTLVMTNSWRALATMARDNIISSNPRDVERILNFWYIRLSSLARLRLFNQTAAECENLFNALTIISPPAARSYVLTRLLPFELEVLRARCAYWAGDYAGYLDDTSALLTRCRARARAARDLAEQSMWRERGARMSLIIASQLVEMNDFTAATALLEPLLASSSPFSPTSSPPPALRSAVARIYLQGGNLAAARAHFALVAADDDADVPLKMMNAVVLAAAEGDWPMAAEHAKKLAGIEPSDVGAVNDHAVALLAMGKVKEGIQLLEQTLQAYPSATTTIEPYLFNLSTMYELRAALAAHKKRDLLVEVAKWSGDGLRHACLKLSS